MGGGGRNKLGVVT